ncbi:MAG: hypothetical protein R2729_04955 [Bryobacteraceae bacterium]
MAITRRGFLWLPSALAAQQSAAVPDVVRYPDPATEFEVLRFTNPAYSSYLPRPYARIFDRRSRNMLYACDRGGSLQAYLFDLKSRHSRQVSEAATLDPASLSLSPNDRGACFIDGSDVVLTNTSSSARGRTLYTLKEVSPGRGLNVTPDGPSVIAVEAATRLLKIPMVRGGPSAIADNPAGVRDPMPRPRRAAVAYRDDSGGLWLAHLDGSRNTQIEIEPGNIGPAIWSPDGKTILYLHIAPRANTIREVDPDTGEDKAIAGTSAYVAFAPNRDASVFVGASGSKAAPYVLVMVRLVKRELALCEHKAGEPATVNPVFTPDSQRICFQSDRHGKPAIYSMAVERLIEKTESGESDTNG